MGEPGDKGGKRTVFGYAAPSVGNRADTPGQAAQGAGIHSQETAGAPLQGQPVASQPPQGAIAPQGSHAQLYQGASHATPQGHYGHGAPGQPPYQGTPSQAYAGPQGQQAQQYQQHQQYQQQQQQQQQQQAQQGRTDSKSRRTLVLAGLAAAAVVLGVILFFVLQSSAAKGGAESPRALADAVFAELGSGETKGLQRLSLGKPQLRAIADCKVDKSYEVGLSQDTNKIAAFTTKGKTFSVKSLEESKHGAPLEKGQEFSPGCVFSKEVEAKMFLLEVEVKNDDGSEYELEDQPSMLALEIEKRWYLLLIKDLDIELPEEREDELQALKKAWREEDTKRKKEVEDALVKGGFIEDDTAVYKKTVAEMKGLADRMCACKTAECVSKVSESMDDIAMGDNDSEAMARAMKKNPDEILALTTRMATCASNAAAEE